MAYTGSFFFISNFRVLEIKAKHLDLYRTKIQHNYRYNNSTILRQFSLFTKPSHYFQFSLRAARETERYTVIFSSAPRNRVILRKSSLTTGPTLALPVTFYFFSFAKKKLRLGDAAVYRLSNGGIFARLFYLPCA